MERKILPAAAWRLTASARTMLMLMLMSKFCTSNRATTDEQINIIIKATYSSCRC